MRDSHSGSCIKRQKIGGCFSGVGAFEVLAGISQAREMSYGRFLSTVFFFISGSVRSCMWCVMGSQTARQTEDEERRENIWNINVRQMTNPLHQAAFKRGCYCIG